MDIAVRPCEVPAVRRDPQPVETTAHSGLLQADVSILAERACPHQQSTVVPAPNPTQNVASPDHDAVGVPTMVGVPVHGKNQDARKAFQYQYSVATAWWQRWYQWYSRTQPPGSVPWSMVPPHSSGQQTSATATPQAQPPSTMLQSQTSADDTACKPSVSAPGSDTGDESLHPLPPSIVLDDSMTKSDPKAPASGASALPLFGPEPQQPEGSGAIPSAIGAPLAQPLMPFPSGPLPAQPISSLPTPAATAGKETMHLPSAAELLTSGLDGATGSSSSTPMMAVPPGGAMYMHQPMIHQPGGARFIQLGTIGEQQYPILSFAGGSAPMPWRPRCARRRRGKSTLPPLPPLPAKLPPELKTSPPDMIAPMARTQSMPSHVGKAEKSIVTQVTASLAHKRSESEAAADAFLDGTASLDEPTFDPREIDELFKDDEDMVGIDVREEGACESDMFGLDIDQMDVAEDHLGSDDGLGSARAHSAPVNAFGSS